MAPNAIGATEFYHGRGVNSLAFELAFKLVFPWQQGNIRAATNPKEQNPGENSP
jgi:hypothetical protein